MRTRSKPVNCSTLFMRSHPITTSILWKAFFYLMTNWKVPWHRFSLPGQLRHILPIRGNIFELSISWSINQSLSWEYLSVSFNSQSALHKVSHDKGRNESSYWWIYTSTHDQGVDQKDRKYRTPDVVAKEQGSFVCWERPGPGQRQCIMYPLLSSRKLHYPTFLHALCVHLSLSLHQEWLWAQKLEWNDVMLRCLCRADHWSRWEETTEPMEDML